MLAALNATGAQADVRVALVIGNGAYEHVPQLKNPINDADDVAAALKRDGFQVSMATDLTKTAMEEATIRFAKAARDADVALFYYSGHALQFGGVNYLAPVDASLVDEADLRRMVRLDDVVSDLQRAKNLRILVLDSCRDNPLAEQLKRSIGNSRAVPLQNGLAKIDAPLGMIVAYATQAGTTADDGDGRNSPYTTAFLKNIERQDEIGTIFRRISSDVYETTKHRQLPELSLSITGEFYLQGKAEISVIPDGTSRSPPEPDMKFKYPFHGVINPPESQIYKVYVRGRESDIIARAGPNEREDGLFRLQPGDDVKASAKYDADDTEGELTEKSWIKTVSPSGQIGFVPRGRLFTPEEFGRWVQILDRIKALRVFFERAEKENSGPYASFAGLYCGGQLDCSGPEREMAFTMPSAMATRMLIWFEGSKIHQVVILGAKELVGEMQRDKPVSFSGDKPPWKGVKNLPSYKITWDNGKSDIYAFNNTNLFFNWNTKGKDSFGVTGKARSMTFEKRQITDHYMVDVAEGFARHGPKKDASSN
ncbi:caspase family protein [Bradyrhizobium sp. WYCCWR 13023]|uniref:Caspase family protein n=1 Tax=Bradyrhizobium zhengyangense TaxID=2911009 RepID=A0A9X1RCH4_9BRAD|nr:caspase family protein [Bradyrhizobium zhengyangense]MCG2628848.1 caspase family protein [Bradyrhizobium zhengyangense]